MALPDRRFATGDLEFADGVITRVVERPIDAPSRLVLPGLVNCHGHTPMTLVRGLGAGLPLKRWLEEAIFPVEARMTAEDIKAGMLWGVMEMLAGGTTFVADMYDFPGECAEVLNAVGFRGRFCRVGLGIVPGRLDDLIGFTRRALAGVRPGDTALADVCIHSEYLTDERFCRDLADAAREFGRPLNFHCSETRREHEECIARHGKTPIAYLAATGILDRGGYAAHCVWCTDDDFRIMAERGVSLVHNPSSNLKLGSGIARIVRARELGVNVALGTDGCASNDNLDMFEEMHLASLLQKGVSLDPTALSAWDVIEMATVNGAKAVGESTIGSLAVGQAADFCVVGLDRPHLLPALDYASLVVHSMHASDVVETWIAGRRLYDRGAYPTLDAARAKADFLAAVRRLAI